MAEYPEGKNVYVRLRDVGLTIRPNRDFDEDELRNAVSAAVQELLDDAEWLDCEQDLPVYGVKVDSEKTEIVP